MFSMSTRAATACALCVSLWGLGAQAADLGVTVSGLGSAEGQVMVALFNDAAGFPQGHPFKGQMAAATKGQVELVFKDLPPGRYAVSAFHDRNGNQRLDANMMGMPTEPYGFSRDAKGQFGPPKFEDAAFQVDRADQHITVRLQ